MKKYGVESSIKDKNASTAKARRPKW